MKSLHEVVVRNRLEQLRKRQRDEALQAQEELLAGVARSASKKTAPEVIPSDVVDEVVAVEEMEPYERSMSPPLIDIRKLSSDEREITVVVDKEDWRSMVGPNIPVREASANPNLVGTTSCSGRFTICGENS